MEMRLCPKSAAGMETVLLSGECDLYTAPSFKNTIITRIRRGLRTLKIDFSEVSYLDSTGVGAIIQIMQTMRTVNGSVIFRGITGSPKKVLEMCNVISLMTIEDKGVAS